MAQFIHCHHHTLQIPTEKYNTDGCVREVYAQWVIHVLINFPQFFYVEWLMYGCVVMCVLCFLSLFCSFLSLSTCAVHYARDCSCMADPRNVSACSEHIQGGSHSAETANPRR